MGNGLQDAVGAARAKAIRPAGCGRGCSGVGGTTGQGDSCSTNPLDISSLEKGAIATSGPSYVLELQSRRVTGLRAFTAMPRSEIVAPPSGPFHARSSTLSGTGGA
jgi:hypothetical protein